MKKMLVICMITGLAMGSGMVFADEHSESQQPPPPEAMGGPGRPNGPPMGFNQGAGYTRWLLYEKTKAKALGITDEQLDRMEKAMVEGEKRYIKMNADVQIARMELRRMLSAEAKQDVQAVDEAIDKIGALETALQKESVHQVLEARDIIGEELFPKVRDAMKERMREREKNRLRSVQEGGRRGKFSRGDGAPSMPMPRQQDVGNE